MTTRQSLKPSFLQGKTGLDGSHRDWGQGECQQQHLPGDSWSPPQDLHLLNSQPLSHRLSWECSLHLPTLSPQTILQHLCALLVILQGGRVLGTGITTIYKVNTNRGQSSGPHTRTEEVGKEATSQGDKAFLMSKLSSFLVSQPQSSQVLQLCQLEQGSSHSWPAWSLAVQPAPARAWGRFLSPCFSKGLWLATFARMERQKSLADSFASVSVKCFFGGDRIAESVSCATALTLLWNAGP